MTLSQDGVLSSTPQPHHIEAWFQSWLRQSAQTSFPEPLFEHHQQIHYKLQEQPPFLHLAFDHKTQHHAVHMSAPCPEFLKKAAQQHLCSYWSGAESFFVLTTDPSLVQQLAQIYAHDEKETPWCSQQLCLSPQWQQRIAELSHQENPFCVQMSYKSQQTTGHCLFECDLLQAQGRYSLSFLVGLFENFGLQVVKNYFYHVQQRADLEINSFELISLRPIQLNKQEELQNLAQSLQQALSHIIEAGIESDPLYQLIVLQNLTLRQLQFLRAALSYLWQIKCPISIYYGSQLLLKYPHLTGSLVDYFEWRFCLDHPSSRHEEDQQRQQQLYADVDGVESSDADLLFRRLIDFIAAITRTNYYQRAADGRSKAWLSFKIKPELIEGMPAPCMAYEIFVYSPQMEGVHLRTSAIARGGIRWSERLEDYRTEVLGLVKAQQVKNSIIVPSGAKGGFVVRSTSEYHPDLIKHCYQIFICGLLDVTDNIAGDQTVRPALTYCWDEADPYLVVAADKGTASFSDLANQIAAQYGFWLSDAFASGGSQGYDHKKLGITAKGACLSLHHHLRDLQLSQQNTEIIAVGIGDMSGDVFGNGAMLLPDLKWKAAFNHKHIFLDPNPHPRAAEERERLFIKARGSWDEYNPELISQGGGVFDRKQKFIALSPEVQQLFGSKHLRLSPQEVIKEILKMKSHVIFNGGIGTYIKSSAESDADVGDRQNDMCRVDAQELQTQIIIEGGNLGVTQKARIAFARLAGKRINTDTLDNSAGVDCSDHEVNIKILLELAIQKQLLDKEERGLLLKSLSAAVCEKVLAHNQHQNEIISLLEYGAPADMLLHGQIISDLVQRGKLDRDLEFLPTPKQILQRIQSAQGLTRPELIILLAYVKIDLKDRLSELDLSQISMSHNDLKDYFPAELSARFAPLLSQHPLADKIISCTLANRFVDELGLSFFYRICSETQAQIQDIFSAYNWVRALLGFPERLQLIKDLPIEVPASCRYHLIIQLQRCMYRCTRWVLKNMRPQEMTVARSQQLSAMIQAYNHVLCAQLPEQLKKTSECPEQISLLSQYVPYEIWSQLCFFTRFVPLFEMGRWAITFEQDWPFIFERYELIAATLRLSDIAASINKLTVRSEWEALARSELREKIERCHVLITEKFYKNWAWVSENQWFLDFWEQQVKAYLALPYADFVPSFVLINHLELLIRGR